MPNISVEKPIPVNSLPAQNDPQNTATIDAPPPLESGWHDLVNAAWYVAFLPMLAWSTMVSSTMKILQSTPPRRFM